MALGRRLAAVENRVGELRVRREAEKLAATPGEVEQVLADYRRGLAEYAWHAIRLGRPPTLAEECARLAAQFGLDPAELLAEAERIARRGADGEREPTEAPAGPAEDET